MSETKILEVKDEIARRLGARHDLTGVEIVRGKPVDGSPDEYISIWKAVAEREYSGLRGGAPQAPMDEVISLTLVVDVALATGTDQESSEARAFEIFNSLETELRADLTLGGIWKFDRISKVEDDFFRDDKRRGCRIFVTVLGKAQI